ncbi:MAG: endonuclease/exonuclease/phosphatase family protein [Candidatus Poribacteria bacterium]|nr:endonuclease/exonuclease/phosphatase family protein [Candidatus Poribacteria bacterium]
MTPPNRCGRLFIAICLLAACSERRDYPIPDIDVSSTQETSTVRLATWNIRIFSDNSRDDRELQLIANVLIDYDFIAIVELRDEAVLQRTERVLKQMGRDYDYLLSRPVGGNVKERYAFMFDEGLVNVLESGMVFPDPNDAFLREPYVASFSAGKFDFTAITAHVIWGDSVPPRQREVRELANVYRAVQAMNGAEQDVILLGDFNRNPDDISAYQPLMSIPLMTRLFDAPHKSHIRDTSLYDNIFFQSSFVTEYTGNSGIDRFDETDFGNDDMAASLAVSDHRPVWGEFRTDRDDD